MRINDILVEFAAGGSGDSGNYFQELASAWYNGTFDTGSLQKGIKSQQDVERLLNRGIVCPDGKTRKLHIDYNADFNGVEIYSDDYYEYGDYDDTIDSRTGQKWGPYDFMEFSDDELDEGMAEAKASTASFRASNKKRAELNSMSDEERRAYDKEQQEKQRKRDDARLERERSKNKSVAEGTPISGDGGAVDNFKQQMANNTELAYQTGMAEGNRKSEPPEADYGDDYQDMVKRVKRLAGVGPLKTQYDPARRGYRNMPTAVQPKK